MQPKASIQRQRLISVITAFILVFTLLVVPGSTSAVASTQNQSYIVQGTNPDQVAHLVESYGGKVTSRLEIIHGVGAILPNTAVASLLAEPAITAVTPNAQVRLSDDGKKEKGEDKQEKDDKKGEDKIPATDYPDVVGANFVWEEGGTGAGVTVAVVDTGMGVHPGLFKDVDGRVRGRILDWKDFVDNRRTPFDPNGHGTHVAGIIANTQVGADNEWNGVAPGVNLVGVRVLNEEGYGTYEQVIEGVQWVVNHKDRDNIRVMNLSLVSPTQSPYWADPLNQAIMYAWAQGITVVVAAGNGGPQAMTVGVPGNNPYVITAGAFTDNYTPYDWSDDYVTPFSAAGPTLDGFVKPDVVAPGAHMVSIMLPSSYIVRSHQANKVSSQYFSVAGTSQAAAVTSGVAALVLSVHPELTPNQVKFRIMVTSFPWVDITTTEALYSMWQQGAGRINAPDAVFGDITGEANQGMDIQADLAGGQHYEGFSYYDQEAGQFQLRGDFADWAGGYGLWSGGYAMLTGGYGLWSGGYGLWSGGYGLWSGGYGLWSGGYGLWSGGYGLWSGGYGLWSGGYGLWSGGYGLWSGSEPWADTNYFETSFVQNFLAGVSPDASTSTTSIEWVDEP